MFVQYPKSSVYSLPWHTDWQAFFRNDYALILEIGFGNGDYLVQLAQHHPDHNIIGLEIASRSLVNAERKIESLQLTNAHVVFGRAETALAHIFAPDSLQEIHINYPDPWFKTRHSGRRLMQRDTLDAMVSRLVVGGKLYLATDIVEYAAMSYELLSATPALTNLLDQPWVNTWQRLITTKYEAKGYAEGRSGNYFAWQRNATPIAPHPTITELDMPHLIIATPMPAQEILLHNRVQSFHPIADTHIKLRDAFLHQNQRALLFELEIIEPTIEQHVAIMLFPREEQPDTYTVKYTTLGQPRITTGLHYATRLVAEWVVSLHPDARVLSSKVSV